MAMVTDMEMVTDIMKLTLEDIILNSGASGIFIDGDGHGRDREESWWGGVIRR